MELTDGRELIYSSHYGQGGPPHELFARLRRESPVHACEPPEYPPFWAVTRHADICEISKNPATWASSPGIFMPKLSDVRDIEGFDQMRVIIETDPPEHRSLRKVTSPWFTPRALARVDEAVNRSARRLVDRMAADGLEGECDFATDIAAAHPLRILSTILGVPQSQEPRILRLSNELFAEDDPELRREGEDRQQAQRELGLEFFQLFAEITEDRRRNPRDDLASVIAHGQVDGAPMGPMETFGYFLITFTAGHDTTKNALVGGMKALIEHPDALAALQRDSELVPHAVEEVVRWTSPVNYMVRTATRDAEVGGQKIREGEKVVMFYCSANRDEDIFEDPFRFRVDRNPNRHLGFGIGEHFCLGAHLARRSQRALFGELARRLESVELAGEPDWIHSSFVVGLKHLPIRYRLRA